MHRSLKIACLIVVVISFTVGCTKFRRAGGDGPAFKGTSADAIKGAEASIAKAKKVKWIWRDTEKMLKKAKEAEKQGDSKKAKKLAITARDQAELAVQQFNAEKSTYKGRFLKGS